MTLSFSIFLLLLATIQAFPVYRKREIVTRMHTASTTNTVTDFYSTTTEVIIAPTVEFIVSGSVTFTTTLYPEGVNPTAVASTITTIQKNVAPTPQPDNSGDNNSKNNSNNSDGNSASQNNSENSSNSNNNSDNNNSDNNHSDNSNGNNTYTNPRCGSQSSKMSSSTSSSSSKTITLSPTASSLKSSSSSTTTSSVSSVSNTVTFSKSSSAESTSTTTITTTEWDTSYTTTFTTISGSSGINSATKTVSSSSKVSNSDSPTSSTSPSGLLKGVPHSLTYSPYNNDGSCKSADQVFSDLSQIKAKGVSNVRIYGTDCNSLGTVQPAAAKLGIKINQGLWITAAGVDSLDAGLQLLINYGKTNGWDIFNYITIGNEAIHSDYCSVEQLIAKIKSVKQALKDAGYSGQVTTSEPPVVFENSPDLCTQSGIDFVGINAHAYFDQYASAQTAGSFVKGQVQLIQNVCGTNNVVVTETGYPSAGKQNGNNIPSPENQRIAIQQILDEMNGQVTVLSSFDDMWKNPGPYGIEQSFGIIDILA